MLINVLGILIGMLSAVWAFRASSHPFNSSEQRNRHLLLFTLLLFGGALVSIVGLILNYRTQTAEAAAQAQRYTGQIQQNDVLRGQLKTVTSELKQERALLERDQEPTLSIEHVGYLPIPGNTELVGLTVRNVGKSPAFRAHSFSALARYPPHSTKRPGLAYTEKDAVGNTDIAPQNTMGIPMLVHVPKRTIKKWESDKAIATFIFGSIWFTSADKRAIEVAFCYRLVNDDFWQPVTPKTCMG